jgi:hypothetical protein
MSEKNPLICRKVAHWKNPAEGAEILLAPPSRQWGCWGKELWPLKKSAMLLLKRAIKPFPETRRWNG